MIRHGLGARSQVGYGLGVSAPGGAAVIPWYRAGGAPAPIAAYQPKGAVDLAASYINLANPGTYNAAPGTAPTFDAATGWTFNGSTQYLTTGITPPATATWSLLIRFSGTPASGLLLGCNAAGGNPSYYIAPNDGAGKVDYRNSALLGSPKAPALAAGVLVMAGTKAYRNGIDEGVTLGSGAGTAVALYLACRNNNGTPQLFCACNIQAVAIYDTTLTAPQVAAVSAAMALL